MENNLKTVCHIPNIFEKLPASNVIRDTGFWTCCSHVCRTVKNQRPVVPMLANVQVWVQLKKDATEKFARNGHYFRRNWILFHTSFNLRVLRHLCPNTCGFWYIHFPRFSWASLKLQRNILRMFSILYQNSTQAYRKHR